MSNRTGRENSENGVLIGSQRSISTCDVCTQVGPLFCGKDPGVGERDRRESWEWGFEVGDSLKARVLIRRFGCVME